MECRLVLNNRTDTDITNKDMCGVYHQQLKYYKFHRIKTKTGKSIFYLYFRKEEDTYAALRAAKSIKGISLVRYRPSNPIPCEESFRPFPPQSIIDACRYALRPYIDRFINVEYFKLLMRRLSEQIMAQQIKFPEIYERLEKLKMWWRLNEHFNVKDNYTMQKILDVFFS